MFAQDVRSSDSFILFVLRVFVAEVVTSLIDDHSDSTVFYFCILIFRRRSFAYTGISGLMRMLVR